jgi:hypothetical protein
MFINEGLAAAREPFLSQNPNSCKGRVASSGAKWRNSLDATRNTSQKSRCVDGSCANLSV